MNRAQIVGHAGNHSRSSTDPVLPETVLNTFNAAGTLTVFTGASKWGPPYDGQIDLVHFQLGTAPTGGSVAFQVNMNGASIGTLTIAAGTLTGVLYPTVGTFTGSVTSDGTYFSVDQTSGSTSLGAKNLAAQFWGHWR